MDTKKRIWIIPALLLALSLPSVALAGERQPPSPARHLDGAGEWALAASAAARLDASRRCRSGPIQHHSGGSRDLERGGIRRRR